MKARNLYVELTQGTRILMYRHTRTLTYGACAGKDTANRSKATFPLPIRSTRSSPIKWSGTGLPLAYVLVHGRF